MDFWQSVAVGIVSGVVILLLEYLVLQPMTARAKSAVQNKTTPSSPASANTILIIEQVDVSTGRERRDRSDEGGWEDYVLPAALAIGFVSSILLIRHLYVVMAILLGVSLAQGVIAVVVYFRHRMPQVRTGLWATFSLISAGVVAAGVGLMVMGRFRGASIFDMAQIAAGSPYWEALNVLTKRFGWEVVGFLIYQSLGILVLVELVVISSIFLVGAAVAAIAVQTQQPRSIHVAIVRSCYPRHPIGAGFSVFLLSTIGLLLVSGSAYSWMQEWQENRGPLFPPEAPSSSPAKPKPTKTK